MTTSFAKCPHCDETFRGEFSPRTVEENAEILVRNHVRDTHKDVLFMCQRRMEVFHLVPGIMEDYWTADHTCSYCGSVSPEQFFAAIEGGAKLTPTDKSYKAYIDVEGHSDAKFYFQHLDGEGQDRLIELVNAKKINFAFPGYFYTLPFFARPKAENESSG